MSSVPASSDSRQDSKSSIEAVRRLSTVLVSLSIVLILIPVSNVTGAQAQCGSPPACFGQSATVYVAGGIVCGGPDNLLPYSGTLNGTSSTDVMVGTDGVDTIVAAGSNDFICGLGGNDGIDAGAGDDSVDAGEGDDTIVGGGNTDLILGGRGNDNIDGGSGIDTLCGQNDDDTIFGGGSSDDIDGSIGTDDLHGDVGTDTCLGGEMLTDCEVTTGTIPACGTPLATITPTATATSALTLTPTLTGTLTPTQTVTFTIANTPTNTITPTRTNTPTRTPGPCNVPPPNNPCIPGGGSRYTDCAVEWLARPVPLLKSGTPVPNVRNGIQKNQLYCYDGDARCDYDGVKDNNSCTFHAALCINNHDPRFPLCGPAVLQIFEVKKPKPDSPQDAADAANLTTLEDQFGPLPGFGLTVVEKDTVVYAGTANSSPDFCSSDLNFVVPCTMTATGRIRKGKKKIHYKETDVNSNTDSDSLRLECRPSTCGNGQIENNHEQCDDSNRNNGDGCNQACQIEASPPTPTPSSTSPPIATATTTPTRTPSLTPTVTPPPGDTNTPAATPTITDTPVSTSTPTITDTPTITPTAAETATATITATPGSAVCGNGDIEDGETCDDGNTMTGDACPPDCVIVSCAPAGTMTLVDVRIQTSQPLASITVLLEYPDGTVQIPGSGNQPQVLARVLNRPSGFIPSFNDLNYALLGTLSSGSFTLANGQRIFTVNFDRCSGAPLVIAADFNCIVDEAVNSSLQQVPGVTCSVTVP